MSLTVEVLNTWSDAWAGLVWAVVWQSTLLAVAVAGVSRLLLGRAAPGVPGVSTSSSHQKLAVASLEQTEVAEAQTL